jgi:hypothetical protein
MILLLGARIVQERVPKAVVPKSLRESTLTVETTSYTTLFTKLQTNSITTRAIPASLYSARSQAALPRAKIRLKRSMFKFQNAT